MKEHISEYTCKEASHKQLKEVRVIQVLYILTFRFYEIGISRCIASRPQIIEWARLKKIIIYFISYLTSFCIFIGVQAIICNIS